jgi:transposase
LRFDGPVSEEKAVTGRTSLIENHLSPNRLRPHARIDGINVMIAQTILAEVGLDMSHWRTEPHFASRLGLCPDNKITGGKVYHR